MLEIATKFLVLPLAIALLMYLIVHFQLLLMHKLLDLDLNHKRRTRINLITFFSVFFGVLILVAINQYLKG